MTDVVTFDVTFHGPFRIATGDPSATADVTVDPGDLLPAPSLKGVMRAAAADVLGIDGRLVAAVFGEPRQPSPWAWSSARFDEATVRQRARVLINPQTATAHAGGLMFAEEVWAKRASFQVSRIGWVDAGLDDHLLVLAVSGAAVHSLGGDRRRGYGWVTLSRAPHCGGDLSDAELERLGQLVGRLP